jgi:hypothetical protein
MRVDWEKRINIIFITFIYIVLILLSPGALSNAMAVQLLGLVGWFVRDGISSSSAENDEEIPIIYQTAGAAAVESQTSLVTSDRGETLSIARSHHQQQHKELQMSTNNSTAT